LSALPFYVTQHKKLTGGSETAPQRSTQAFCLRPIRPTLERSVVLGVLSATGCGRTSSLARPSRAPVWRRRARAEGWWRPRAVQLHLGIEHGIEPLSASLLLSTTLGT